MAKKRMWHIAQTGENIALCGANVLDGPPPKNMPACRPCVELLCTEANEESRIRTFHEHTLDMVTQLIEGILDTGSHEHTALMLLLNKRWDRIYN